MLRTVGFTSFQANKVGCTVAWILAEEIKDSVTHGLACALGSPLPLNPMQQ